MPPIKWLDSQEHVLLSRETFQVMAVETVPFVIVVVAADVVVDVLLKHIIVKVGNGLPPEIEQIIVSDFDSITWMFVPFTWPFITGGPSGGS